MIYKVSYVVSDGSLPGGIKNETEPPIVGMIVKIGPNEFEVIEVHEIMPPRGDFLYLHATIEPAREEEAKA
jgi:hypothetical protein